MNNKKTFYTNPISLTFAFDQVDYDYIITCLYSLQSVIEKELQEIEADSNQTIQYYITCNKSIADRMFKTFTTNYKEYLGYTVSKSKQNIYRSISLIKLEKSDYNILIYLNGIDHLENEIRLVITNDQIQYNYIEYSKFANLDKKEIENPIIQWSDKDLFIRSIQEPYKPVVGKIKIKGEA